MLLHSFGRKKSKVRDYTFVINHYCSYFILIVLYLMANNKNGEMDNAFNPILVLISAGYYVGFIGIY